ncbi:hypothetical protein HYS93_02710 [Candidatus Daviesbacteria bacterium]|nr:hypothetical protein [Candidatus Daviesbacteria bacterium]
MNAKIAMSGISILSAMAIVVGATYAYFSDSGTSSENVFTAGTLDMQLSNNNEGFADNVTATVGGSNMAPGDTFNGDLFVKNSGSTNANHIDLDFTNSVTEGAGVGSGTTPNFASVLEITAMSWDSDANGSTDTDVLALAAIPDFNSNSIVDLQDLENVSATAFRDRVNLPFGGTQSTGHKLHIEGRLNPTLAVSSNQGDSDSLTIGVFMNQGTHASE